MSSLLHATAPGWKRAEQLRKDTESVLGDKNSCKYSKKSQDDKESQALLNLMGLDLQAARETRVDGRD
jgi:hypothetical protein